ncbi:hypothetical protein [Mesorhizobium hawassense]|uniref:hypothetical protein n=1 Tax=Mesorhizobium hawassense TaxID=1209954 RepID=UPI00142D3D7B|nr:hypothetical protein [Mesorhizobium hawassense]
MDYLQIYLDFARKTDDKSRPQLTVAKLALGETPRLTSGLGKMFISDRLNAYVGKLPTS